MKKMITGLLLSSVCASALLAESSQLTEIQKLRQDVDALQATKVHVIKDTEDNALSGFWMAGYAAFDFASEENGEDAFGGVKFSPIFHYQYGNIFQFEGELEMTVNAEGEAEIELEYAAGTLFINDYVGLQMGKFMSPLGQFVQNQHPSWINKLPSTPVGFGHDGAAPTSNVGAALRGGLPKIAEIRSNYVVFVSNAPSFGLADDGDVVIEAVGRTTTSDAAMTVGGRYAINPLGNMEIGISAATGEVSEELLVNNTTITRDYDVFGADLMANYLSFALKAEYIQQKIGENVLSTLEGGTWKAWYTQLSYQFDTVKIEPVLRYSDYHNPETNRNQVAIGLNYLFTNNLIAKCAYEINKDEDDLAVDSAANNNRFLIQLAYGF